MQKRNSILIILFILFGLNILAWQTVFCFNSSGYLEVIFLDVGQGDSIFIQTPQLNQILIDGGFGSAVLGKLSKYMPFWDRTIDLVILTHPENDHLGGLLEVLENYKVENILWTGVLRDTRQYEKWVELIEQEGANIIIAQAGEKISWQNGHLKILYPFDNIEGQFFKNTNNTSIVARLVFNNTSFLFTGDILKKAEKELINIDSQVLKVAHHGSKTSSSDQFLKKASPEIAVICVGNNSYGHPHQEVLARLIENDINILRTDQLGDIKIISDGNNLK